MVLLGFSGTNTLVIGRSKIVGQPLSIMLGHRGATVTVAHSLTPPETLANLCHWADLIVSAAGVPHLVRGGMVRSGAVVIDVGINRLPKGGIVGDVHFEGKYSLMSKSNENVSVTQILRSFLRRQLKYNFKVARSVFKLPQ